MECGQIGVHKADQSLLSSVPILGLISKGLSHDRSNFRSSITQYRKGSNFRSSVTGYGKGLSNIIYLIDVNFVLD